MKARLFIILILSIFTLLCCKEKSLTQEKGKETMEAEKINTKIATFAGGCFWRHTDPTDEGGQFVDRGAQYRSVIFYQNEEEKRLAEESKEKLGKSGRFRKPIVTEILPLKKFYNAEDYHQDYYKKHSFKYKFYRNGSGRDKYLKEVWGKEMENKNESTQKKHTKLDDTTLRKILTPLHDV